MRNGMVMAALALAIAACGARPEAPPVLIEPSHIGPLLEQSREYDGRRVAIDGYIHIDNGPDGGAVAMVYTLTSRPRGLGDELIRFEAERGAGASQLDLPVLERESLPGMAGAGEILLVDLKAARFVDATGTPHPLRDKVRVTGRIASGPGVEDARAPGGRRYRPRLTDVVLKAAP